MVGKRFFSRESSRGWRKERKDVASQVFAAIVVREHNRANRERSGENRKNPNSRPSTRVN